ncbi:hypothetical protein HW932_01630 [Allochromatium humboldtianum]|uniref:Uncharacterized protein n=1 Tax=Allochromatium humboldtianum TaxID=504901 RepID=A0A850R083_9GAMM|nr:hypothetical protein [Allochromatium humboldtianum]NVZ07959.1 hypothetical protein [Allochromatium humboldtianum]
MSSLYQPLQIKTLEVCGLAHALRAMRNPMMSHERASPDADLKLAAKLVRAGDEHAKAIRGVIAYFELQMQIGWMVEWDTYRVGVEVLSTSSTMHTDLKGMKGIELAEAKQANLPNVVYTQTAMASYQALRRIYFQRRHHRHPDWQCFCRWIESLPNFHYLIVPETSEWPINS